MRKVLLLLGATVLLSGCKPVPGERFWWDDQKKEQLPNTYMLPDWPAAAPVPTEPEPFVPKLLPRDEIKRAQTEQQKKITVGIPRVGVPDPNANPVKLPVAKWEGGEALDDTTIEIKKKGKETDISEVDIKEQNGNITETSEEITIKNNPQGQKSAPANDTGSSSVPGRAKASAATE